MFKILKSLSKTDKVVIENDDGTCKLIGREQISGAIKEKTTLFRTNYLVQEIPAVLDRYSEINSN